MLVMICLPGHVLFTSEDVHENLGSRTFPVVTVTASHPVEQVDGRWPHLRKVPRRRRIGHAYPMWLWGHSLLKISSPGPVLHGTKWLLWRPHRQGPALHSKCRINKGLIERGSTIDRWRLWHKGRSIMAHTSYPHSFKWLVQRLSCYYTEIAFLELWVSGIYFYCFIFTSPCLVIFIYSKWTYLCC
jgi:hypothetical protein